METSITFKSQVGIREVGNIMCQDTLKYSVLSISISQALLEGIKQRAGEFDMITTFIIISICGQSDLD
jgi:hypothetical protein